MLIERNVMSQSKYH